MSFGERLDKAIRERKSSRAALARELRVSPQAIGLVITGDSKAMSAENAAKTARFLRVDYVWLATGEGEMDPQPWWPVERVPVARFLSLPPEERANVEGRLEEAIRDCEHRMTPPPTPPARTPNLFDLAKPARGIVKKNKSAKKRM